MYACMHTYVLYMYYVRTYLGMYVCIYICMHVRMYCIKSGLSHQGKKTAEHGVQRNIYNCTKNWVGGGGGC
jgi:hypothetical protein